MATNRIAQHFDKPSTLPGVGDFVNLVALVKGRERYLLIYDSDCKGKTEALRQIGKWASHPELSFSWYDAAVLSGKVRQEAAT